MKFYKSRYFWFFAIALVLVSLLINSFYLNSKNQALDYTNLLETSNTETKEEKKVFKFNKTTFYTPAVGLKSVLLNVNSIDLKAKEVLVLSSNLEEIKKIQSIEALQYKGIETIEELNSLLNADLNRISFMKVEEVNLKVKALGYDGLDLFQKAINLENYKLKLSEELTADKETSDITNFDQAQLKVIGHTGSIIGARGVMNTARTRFNNDYTKLFASTKPLFDRMDYVSGTLEAPFLGKGRECGSCLTFVGDDRIADGIKYSGIDMLGLGANHIMNGGIAALENSQKILTEKGILHTGASSKNNDEAGKPVLAEINGLKIAYLSFVDSPGRSEWAGPNSPGAANISDWEVSNGRTTKYEPNEERIKYFIQRAKDLKPDLVFIIMHWGGQEYTQRPTGYTRNLAKLMIKHGADGILGDHPHWVQEMEFIDGKPVWYCVGNYVFDQTWSEETRQGLSIEIAVYNGKIINFKAHPHYMKIQGIPELLQPTDPKYKLILNRMWDVTKIN